MGGIQTGNTMFMTLMSLRQKVHCGGMLIFFGYAWSPAIVKLNIHFSVDMLRVSFKVFIIVLFVYMI